MQDQAAHDTLADKYASILAKEEDLLHAKVVQTMSAYNAEPTSANLRNWQSAKRALTEYRAAQAEDGEKLRDKAAIARWIISQGYRLPGKASAVSEKSVYNHINAGLIPMAKDGGYTLKAVQDYAARHLEGGPSTSSTGSTPATDDKARFQKALADEREIKVAVMKRDYIPLAEEERRDAAILAGIRGALLNQGPYIIGRIKSGQADTEAELLAAWNDMVEEAFDIIARTGYVEAPAHEAPETA